MPRAIWQGVVLAESANCDELEGNTYFPPEGVKREFLRPSETTSVCPWKGAARYYHVEVNGLRNADAAWYYPEPSAAARAIKDHVAFWKGVLVER